MQPSGEGQQRVVGETSDNLGMIYNEKIILALFSQITLVKFRHSLSNLQKKYIYNYIHTITIIFKIEHLNCVFSSQQFFNSLDEFQ